jgi:hypothetical protein
MLLITNSLITVQSHFMLGMHFWKSRIIQGKFSHRNKFALFETWCIKQGSMNIFYVTLFQICITQIHIKCDHTVPATW